ncbi:Na+/H+ antiporter family protein [Paraclostridium sordellii]|uniref:Na+/H+ antiporter family protein n=1 Tax=Paraclostridium sordellii TaxID=1505 RepID=UPI0005EA4183|nr:Na+/H+ antiporter family protein [Paeniclostridium sordellii]MDU6481596.1 Na+/H+ antiporter family protein [Paeniclostridium sordellii]CEN25717.1 transport protein (Na /H antiporter [[Clostridium] sordellii] [Paeniclostridium sordellii]CEN30000.1 transport protein (Na /H antiporter [[Clostridium] sordellii] [Paeniclostridium sordellii]CEN30814.1 transport protein (Na /H antiporter [[Clostridium] sordellii] [Paeniclostridium sordellii]CEP46333.1 transport protein (Na /H antiporter [[Clostrid
MVLFNPVVISIVVMIILCLFKFNVLLSILVAAIVAGVFSGIPIGDTMNILVSGMGGNAETALSYILLGALAIAVSKTGLASMLSKKISKIVKDKKITLILIIAFMTCFSQNLIPVHIAFIPILIPSLLELMNKLKIDRRGVACALTFGLKTPYLAIPVGFGLIFQNIIRDQMIANKIDVTTNMVTNVMWIPALGMILGLLTAIFISYRKPRDYKKVKLEEIQTEQIDDKMTIKHWFALTGAITAFVVQIITGSLPLGGLCAIIVLFLTRAIKFNEIDDLLDGGVKMMGMIGFIMLVAAGYGNVLRQTGAVESLVASVSGIVGNNQLIGALLMLLVGLLVTMGIGSSFGTLPIIAAIYCPLGLSLGFSIPAIILLVGVAGALGDAGSPASDSTLGPTAGLNADKQHDHIWDTCVPTFLHYNIPLLIFGIIGALIL